MGRTSHTKIDLDCVRLPRIVIITHDDEINCKAAECAEVEAMQVAAGLWLRDHLPDNAIVATHDAGAIRYFGERPVIDIHGIHTGELQHREREHGPEAVLTWLVDQAPDALVVFPMIWANGHSPELIAFAKGRPRQEVDALVAVGTDYAAALGLTERVQTFHTDSPATVPDPIHADLAIFMRP